MADFHKALAPLGPLVRWILFAVVLEALLLLAERFLVHAVGQHAIAAAMITTPKSITALLGAVAVLVRISAHALFPALAVFHFVQKATLRALG